jgi:two-component system cell cycle sensor histidine kinase/response regulator CckA
VLSDLQPIFRQLMTDNVNVRIDTERELWRVKADQGQIEQVVVNLATNARDAMPRGGPLRIVTRNQRVEVTHPIDGLPVGDFVALEVIDAGTGMDDGIRARIFEPFFSTKPKDRGVGLGLAMVHGIVTRAGGHVLVDTAPDRERRSACFSRVRPKLSISAPPSRKRSHGRRSLARYCW